MLSTDQLLFQQGYPGPWGPYRNQLPLNTDGQPYVGALAWNQVINNFANWRGTVNANGNSLTGVDALWVRRMMNPATGAPLMIFASGCNFQAQAPAGTLTAGQSATVTLSPVPQGVNASNGKYYMYISGGTGGAAEAVLITGGTAISGSASGTVTFTPANSHAGNWIIGSATCGLAEAAYVASVATGGCVRMTSGTYQLQALIPFMPNVTFWGDGPSTVLIPASSTAVVFDALLPVKSAVEYTLNADNVAFRDFVIDASSFPGVNGVYGIREFNQSASTELWSLFGCIVENVQFNNVYNSIYFHRARGVRVRGCKLWENSTLTFFDSTDNASYHSADIIVSDLDYYWHPIIGNTQVASMAAPVVTLVNCETSYIIDSVFTLPGATSNTGAAYGVSFGGTGENLGVFGCKFENPYTAIYLGAQTISGTTYYPGFVDIIDCTIDQIWGPAIACANGTGTGDGNQVAHITIAHNQLTDLIAGQGAQATFLNTGTYSKHWIFGPNLFRNVTGAASQTAIIIGSGADSIHFDRTNLFLNETGSSSGSTGIFISSAAMGVYGLENLHFTNFGTNINDGAATVASSTALAIPSGRRFITITGTTGITSISTSLQAGSITTLLVTGALTLTKGSNLKLNSNMTTTGSATDSLTLYYDGTNYIEISRSVN